MFNIKRYNLTSGYTAFMAGLLLCLFSSGVIACTPAGHIDFHNHAAIPLKLVIKTLPGSVVNCKIPDKVTGLKDKGCKGYNLKYQKYTINIPAKKHGKLGLHNGVCISNDDLYMVSYRTLIADGKNPPVNGPVADVNWFVKDKSSVGFELKHGGHHGYITSVGCNKYSRSSTMCVVRFYKTL